MVLSHSRMHMNDIPIIQKGVSAQKMPWCILIESM